MAPYDIIQYCTPLDGWWANNRVWNAFLPREPPRSYNHRHRQYCHFFHAARMQSDINDTYAKLFAILDVAIRQ